MYILLILLVGSLAGMGVMIGRKLRLVGEGQISEKEYAHPFVPDLEKAKHLALANAKKYGRLGLVETLRLYIRSSNFLKNQYHEAKTKLKNINQKKNGNGVVAEKVEVSKFLKMISDYKHKIREIKHKIREEEKNS